MTQQTPPPGAPPQQYAQQGPPPQGQMPPGQFPPQGPPQGFPPHGQQAPYPPVGHVPAGHLGGGSAGFGRVVLSEWTKIRTVRSTMWTLIVMAGLILGMALLLGGTVHLDAGDDYIAVSLIGVVMAQIAAATLGVLSISAEYTTGMIRTTLTAYPRRLQVFAAKALVFAGLMFVVGLVTISLASVLGNAMLTSRFGDSEADTDIFRSVLGSSLFLAVIGLLGLGLGALIRHSAGAITALLGAILLPMIIGPIVGTSVGEKIMEYSPMFALLRLIGGTEGEDGLGAWPSLLLVAGYAAIALIAGATRLQTRDV